MNIDTQTSGCRHAEDVVSFLYNEMREADRDTFARHLEACSSCMTELAGFQKASSAVAEWRMAAFDTIPTPRVAIPYATEAERKTFGETIAAFFSSKLVYGFAAVVVLAVVGIGVWTLMLSTRADVARTEAPQPVAVNDRQAVPVPRPQIVPAAEDKNVAALDKPEPKVDRSVPASADVSPRRSPRLHSRPSATEQAVRRPADIDNGSARTTGVRAPSLSDGAEVKDRSLRLADLFAETEDME